MTTNEKNIIETFPLEKSGRGRFTHKVISKTRLALRDTASFLPSSDDAAEDSRVKGNVVDMLSPSTKLYVIEEGIGYNCEWSQVEVYNKKYKQKKLFVKSQFIAPLSSTPKSANVKIDKLCWGNERIPKIIDWMNLEENRSHFDEHDAKYKVCVDMFEMGYVGTGGSKIFERMEEAALIGLKIIFKENSKRHDDEFVKKYIDKLKKGEIFRFCKAEEYYIDPRPNSGLKVLVTLSRKYLLPVENDKNISINSDGIPVRVRWDDLERVVFKSSYRTDKIRPLLKKVVMMFKNYHKEVLKFEGTVEDYNFLDEADNLKKLLVPLIKILRLNKVDDCLDKKEHIEIGWDNTLTLVYMSLTRENGIVISFSNGMDELSSEFPFDNQRTQGYFWNLSKLAQVSNSTMPWTEFLFKYTLPEPPKVLPSKRSDSKNYHENIGNISGNKSSKIEGKISSLNDSPVKVYKDKLLEDRSIQDVSLKQEMFSNRKDAYDFVGDFTASCEGVQSAIENINTVDDAFSVILDKINIADLISQCMDSVSASLPTVQDIIPDEKSLIPDNFGSGIGINSDYDTGINYNFDSAKDSFDSSVFEKIGTLTFSQIGVDDYTAEQVGIAEQTPKNLGIEDKTFNQLSIPFDEYYSTDVAQDKIYFKKNGTELYGDGKLVTSDGEESTADSFQKELSEMVSNSGDNSFMNYGMSNITLKDLGLLELPLSSLGLSGVSFESLGLSSYEIVSIGEKIKSLGIPEASNIIDEYDFSGVTSVPSYDTNDIDLSLTNSIDSAKEKLGELTQFANAGDDMFGQISPSLPTSLSIGFPDSLPTQDIMASLADSIEFGLTTLLNELFVAMVKSILGNLSDSCNATGSGEEDYGGSNLNKMLEDSVPRASAGQSGLGEAMDSVAAAAGLISGDYPTSAGLSEKNRVKTGWMLDDISLLLTPVELCSLLNGKANPRTLRMTRRLLNSRYPEFKLKRKSDIIRFFKFFGSMIDQSICRVIESPTPSAPNYTLGDLLCSPNLESSESFRRKMMEDKNDGITDEQIALQLEKARKRKANAAKILADFVNNGPLSDDFETPPVFCQKGGSDTSSKSGEQKSLSKNGRKRGLVDLSHDSIDFAVDKAVDLMFEPVYTSFGKDVSRYPSAFVEESKKQENVKSYDGDIINPRVSAQYGSDRETINAISDGDEIKISSGTPEIFPALKQSLLEIEKLSQPITEYDHPAGSYKYTTDSNLLPEEYENGAYSIKLKIPTTSIDVDSLFAPVLEKVSGDEKAELKDTIEKIKEGLDSNSWYIYYVEPLVNKSVSLKWFPFTILVAKNDVEISYRYSGVVDVDDLIVQELLDPKYDFDNSSNTVELKRHKFASLLINSYKQALKDNHNVNFKDYYPIFAGYYEQAVKDSIANVSQQVATISPMFKTVDVAVPGRDEKISLPIIQTINLDPEQTLEQRAANCDPHLLDLQNLKDKLKKEVKDSACVDLNAPTDGSAADELTDQERKIMNLVVRTTIRTYMIDYYMRGIFFNTTFKSSSAEMDSLYLDSISKFILDELSSYDEPNTFDDMPLTERGTYQKEFIENSFYIYKETEEYKKRSEETSVFIDENDDTSTDIIKALVGEQYSDVIGKMNKLTGNKRASVVDEYFKRIPVLSLPTYYPNADDDVNKNRIKKILEDTSSINRINNGNFYIENYYYVEDHKDKPNNWPENVRPFEYADDLHPKYYKYFGTMTKDDLSYIFDAYVELGDGTGSLSGDDPESSLFKKVYSGSRMVYVPPLGEVVQGELPPFYTSTEESIYKNLFLNQFNISATLNTNTEESFETNEIDKKKVIYSKCFRTFEYLISNKKMSGDNHFHEYQYQEMTTIPVIDVRKEVLTNDIGTIEISVKNTNQFRTLFEYLLPLENYKSFIETYSIQASKYNTEVVGAMSGVKDELRRLFFSVNSKGDYKQRDPALDEVGGTAGLEKMMRNEFGVKDTPASPNSWNYNLPLGWGKSVKGLGFEEMAKATGDAILKIFKRQAEKSDPNISIAYKLAMASKLAGVNVPTSAWSFLLLPANVFPPPLGIGPPIGPMGWVYHTLGLGTWLNVEGAAGKDAEAIREKIAESGVDTSSTCDEDDMR